MVLLFLGIVMFIPLISLFLSFFLFHFCFLLWGPLQAASDPLPGWTTFAAACGDVICSFFRGDGCLLLPDEEGVGLRGSVSRWRASGQGQGQGVGFRDAGPMLLSPSHSAALLDGQGESCVMRDVFLVSGPSTVRAMRCVLSAEENITGLLVLRVDRRVSVSEGGVLVGICALMETLAKGRIQRSVILCSFLGPCICSTLKTCYLFIFSFFRM